MDEALAEELARRLYEAEHRCSPIPPLTDAYPDLTVADAYAVQRALIARKLEEGARVVGWKIGLTSRPMQQMFGIDTPDFGHLLDTMALPSGAELPCSQLIAPRVEPEFAFVLARDLAGPGVREEDVLAATEAVALALEVIDSRIEGWRIRLADTIADNASSARFVLGQDRRRPSMRLSMTSRATITASVAARASSSLTPGPARSRARTKANSGSTRGAMSCEQGSSEPEGRAIASSRWPKSGVSMPNISCMGRLVRPTFQPTTLAPSLSLWAMSALCTA